MRVLKPGDLIADRYRIDTVIARGGMGAVYRATDERVGRAVAIKVLLKELADDAVSIARFEREVTAAARLDHPGVVSVLDFGTTPEGVAYLVMEHVSGQTLAQVLDREGRIAPARAVDIIEQALGALEAAHAAGIVHRDLKPGNLMLVPAGVGGREVVKLLDFGVAQLRTGTAYTRLTQAGTVVGTPSFMSPEQARGEECDPRTDVYAIGMVLWCSLTGMRAFKGNDLASLMVALQTEVPARADQVVTGIPSELASIVARALEKRPEDRWQSATELAAALVASRSRPGLEPAPPALDGDRTIRDAPMIAVLTPPTREGPALVVPRAPIPKVVLGDPSAQPRSIWPTLAFAVVVLGLVAALVAVGLFAFGLFELESHARLPTLPFPIGTTPTPTPVVAPPMPVPSPMSPEPEAAWVDPDVCNRAFDCCTAYVDRVAPLEAPCAEMVGHSPVDDASCQVRFAEWAQLASARGAVLPECM